MGKINKYDWGISKELPLIEEHSIVKLKILEGYLRVYMEKLCSIPYPTKLKFAIIDGFAGGGLYQDAKRNEILGSPLRILETVNAMQKEINFKREQENKGKITFEIPIYLVEKNKNTFNFLSQTLKTRDYSSNVFPYHGAFEEQYIHILQELQRNRYSRAIFILDQYGYSDANLKIIKRILKDFRKPEIILTFACDSLIDYLSQKNQKALLNLGLSADNIEYLLDTKEDNDRNRKNILNSLLSGVTESVGACFYTPFFVKGVKTHRAYWLLHFSNHPIARDEMVKLHYKHQNDFIHYGGEGLDMFGFSTKEQMTLNPFLFTEQDKEKSLQIIKQQIPEKMKNYDGRTFGDFIRDEINQTPATIEIIQNSLNEALYYGDIEFFDQTGKKIKQSKNIKLDDHIKIGRQQRFKF